MVEALIGIFTAITLIVKFVKSILVKYVLFGVVLTFQFGVAAATIAFIIAFYAFIITSLITAYNFGISTAEYIADGMGSGTVVSCFIAMLELIGVTSALNNGYAMFFASLSFIAIFHLMKFTYWAMKQIANEVFKLGVLLGQALS